MGSSHFTRMLGYLWYVNVSIVRSVASRLDITICTLRADNHPYALVYAKTMKEIGKENMLTRSCKPGLDRLLFFFSNPV
jgi:hypothetical protein